MKSNNLKSISINLNQFEFIKSFNQFELSSLNVNEVDWTWMRFKTIHLCSFSVCLCYAICRAEPLPRSCPCWENTGTSCCPSRWVPHPVLARGFTITLLAGEGTPFCPSLGTRPICNWGTLWKAHWNSGWKYYGMEMGYTPPSICGLTHKLKALSSPFLQNAGDNKRLNTLSVKRKRLDQ